MPVPGYNILLKTSHLTVDMEVRRSDMKSQRRNCWAVTKDPSLNRNPKPFLPSGRPMTVNCEERLTLSSLSTTLGT